jgi:hypothetical protein
MHDANRAIASDSIVYRHVLPADERWRARAMSLQRARAGLTAKLAHNHELRTFCAELAELFAHALDFGFIEQWSDPHPMH